MDGLPSPCVAGNSGRRLRHAETYLLSTKLFVDPPSVKLSHELRASSTSDVFRKDRIGSGHSAVLQPREDESGEESGESKATSG